MAKGRFAAKKRAHKQAIAEDKYIRQAGGFCADQNMVRIPSARSPNARVYTPGQVDKRLGQMRKSAELTTKSFAVMEIPEDEKVWRQVNGIMPQDTSGNAMPAVPFLVTESVKKAHEVRLIPPYIEGNKMLGNPPRPSGHPKQLNSKAQKEAKAERQKRAPIQVN